MAKGPKNVLKRLIVKPTSIAKDANLKRLHTVWAAKADLFVKARETSEKAKADMLDVLLPNLEGQLAEWNDGNHFWEVRKDDENRDGLIVEVFKGKKGVRRSRIDEEEVDF